MAFERKSTKWPRGSIRVVNPRRKMLAASQPTRASAPGRRARIPALAARLLEEIPGIDKPNPVSESVAALIAERCEDYRSRFSKK